MGGPAQIGAGDKHILAALFLTINEHKTIPLAGDIHNAAEFFLGKGAVVTAALAPEQTLVDESIQYGGQGCGGCRR